MEQKTLTGLKLNIKEGRKLFVEPNTHENRETVRKRFKIAQMHMQEDYIYLIPHKIQECKTYLESVQNVQIKQNE